MKTIKSVLLSALVALVGSSVWAVTIQSDYINFASGLKTVNYKRTSSDKSPTTWRAWSESPEFVTATIEGGTGEGTEASKSTLADTNTAKAVVHLVPNAYKNTDPIVAHFENDVGDVLTITARVDVVACQNVHLKHPESDDDPQGWFEIDPAEYPGVIPANFTAADSHAYSTDTNIVKIVEKDGKYYLHAPVDCQDGQARCVFIKSEDGVLNDDEKIWMFYVTVSTVELEKWLTFPDESKKDSEATLNIRAHYLNLTNEPVTKVLFVGSGCSTHGLTQDAVLESVSNIATKADVDIYILHSGDSLASVKDRGCYNEIKKGTKVTAAMLGMTGNYANNLAEGYIRGSNGSRLTDTGALFNGLVESGHSVLEAMYQVFYSIAKDEKTRYKYDYIVMEFDGQRIAMTSSTYQDNYVRNPERDAVVAEWLNEYYEGGKDEDGARIVWITDDQVNKSGLVYDVLHGSESEEDSFRPYMRGIKGSSSNYQQKVMEADRFVGLLGLLNPWLVIEKGLHKLNSSACTAEMDRWAADTTNTRRHTYTINTSATLGSTATQDYTVPVGETYKYQTNYNDVDAMGPFLAKRIQPISYSATIIDNVETQGLSFVENTLKIYGSYTTNEVGVTDASTDGWVDLKNPLLGMLVEGDVRDLGHNSISGKVDQLTREFWTWIQVGLKDTDGSFRAGAKKDYPTVGKSARDPNLNTNALDHTLGQAAKTEFYEVSKSGYRVSDEAETLWDWEFDSLPITLNSEGVNREYDGTSTNATYTVDPADAKIMVSYSNDVEKIWTALEDYAPDKFTDCTNVWARFVATKDGYLSVTSESQVVITPLPVTVALVGSTNIYTAAGQTVKTVTVNPTADVGDSSRKTELSFSSDNATWSGWVACDNYVSALPTFTNCGTYTVYAKVRNLPNYTNDTVVSADVLITQRVITVTAQFAEKDYNTADPAFAWELGGDYVPSERDWIINEKFGGTGSGLVRPGAGTQERAGSYTDAITSNKVFNAGGNYIVEFYKGNFRINPKKLVLTATPADHAYDGTGYTIGLSINYDKDEKTGDPMWVSVRKGEGEWSNWVEWENLETVLPKITNVVDSTTISARAVCNRPVTAPKPLLTASASNNYTASDTASATVTITPIPATVTAGDLTKLKGEPDPDPYSATITTTGLIPADEGKVTFAYSMRINKHKENVGKYKNVVEPFGAADQGNYTVTYVAGTLIIASNGDPCEGLTGVCACGEVGNAGCLVYDVVIKVKTLKPQKKSGCGEIGDVYYLSDTTRTIKGYMWFCGDGCWSTDDAVRLALWDKKAKSAIVPLYYAVEDGVMVQYPYTFNFDFLGRYTKKANKIAANWTLDEGVFTLGCAAVNGSSTLDKEEGTIRLKSISGNCAGMLSLGDVTVKGHCGEESTFTAKIAELCDCWDNWCDDGDDADEVPATGTWKITYNKKLSKSSKSMLETVPSYAREPKPAEPAK